jgi:hypothetical protein
MVLQDDGSGGVLMESHEARFPRRGMLKALAAVPLAAFLPLVSSGETVTTSTVGNQQVARLELIPPSLVTDKIMLDIRGAVENNSGLNREYTISLYLDQESPNTLVCSKKSQIPPHRSFGIYYRYPTDGWVGRHKVIMVATSPDGQIRKESEIEVLSSKYRCTRTIGGAWVDILHWSKEEAFHYGVALRKLTGSDWGQQIRGMHSLRMDVIVVQEVFWNQAYYGTHTISKTGYRGLAFYPSALFSGRAHTACHDPLEAILSEADQLHMSVFLGVGLYAWRDFSAASLDWHKKIAAELWHRYGLHPSFYGWYVSEEAFGSLIMGPGERAKDRYRQEVVTFFTEFRSFCRGLAPEKPIMLAPNTWGLRESQDVWPLVLKHLDIICPFAFGRMPSGDLTAQQAANIWQDMCDKSSTHLWLDMEAFVFQGKALVPRPIEGIIQELDGFTNFEKILCYEYSGIFNSPASRIKPGGPPTVALFRKYQQYLKNLSLPPAEETLQ